MDPPTWDISSPAVGDLATLCKSFYLSFMQFDHHVRHQSRHQHGQWNHTNSWNVDITPIFMCFREDIAIQPLQFQNHHLLLLDINDVSNFLGTHQGSIHQMLKITMPPVCKPKILPGHRCLQFSHPRPTHHWKIHKNTFPIFSPPFSLSRSCHPPRSVGSCGQLAPSSSRQMRPSDSRWRHVATPSAAELMDCAREVEVVEVVEVSTAAWDSPGPKTCSTWKNWWRFTKHIIHMFLFVLEKLNLKMKNYRLSGCIWFILIRQIHVADVHRIQVACLLMFVVAFQRGNQETK